MSFLFIACNSTAVDSEKNADTEENITPEKSNAGDKKTNNEQKPSGDNRLRIEKDLNGHQTVLILNAPMVASKGGSTEIDLNIIIAEKGKERYEIGKLNLPINN